MLINSFLFRLEIKINERNCIMDSIYHAINCVFFGSLWTDEEIDGLMEFFVVAKQNDIPRSDILSVRPKVTKSTVRTTVYNCVVSSCIRRILFFYVSLKRIKWNYAIPHCIHIKCHRISLVGCATPSAGVTYTNRRSKKKKKKTSPRERI